MLDATIHAPAAAGKKSRKCCLGKIEVTKTSLEAQPVEPGPAVRAAAAETRPVPKPGTPDPVEEPPESDPVTVARDACWQEFEEADYEEKLALFSRTLHESKGLIDAELRIHSLGDLEGLADDLCRILEQSDDDPSLIQACKRWRAEVGKPVPGGEGATA